MYANPPHILELFQYQKQEESKQTLTRIENLQLARERIPGVFEPRLWPEYADAAVPELYLRVAHAVRSGQLVFDSGTWRGPLGARRESETLAYRLQENPASLPQSWYSTGILFPSLPDVVSTLMYEDELRARRPLWMKAFNRLNTLRRRLGLHHLEDAYALLLIGTVAFLLTLALFTFFRPLAPLVFLTVLVVRLLLSAARPQHTEESPAPSMPPTPTLTPWQSVERVQRVLEQSVQEAEKAGDPQWLFDARSALTEYLPETVKLHVERQGQEQDPEFQTMLSDIQAIGTRASHENLQRRWESQQRFLSERAKQTTT